MIVEEIDCFTTDYGTYSLPRLLVELRDMENAMADAAADIIEIMMPDHKEAQERRRLAAIAQFDEDVRMGRIDPNY